MIPSPAASAQQPELRAFSGITGLTILYGVNGTVLLLVNRFLIVAACAGDLGQRPLGDEAVTPSESEQRTAKSHAPGSMALYRSPVFWLCLVGDWSLAGGVNYITMYATSFFSQNGIEL